MPVLARDLLPSGAMDITRNLQAFTAACTYCREIVLTHVAHLGIAETNAMRQHLRCCDGFSADPGIADSRNRLVDPLAHFTVFRVGATGAR